jgi:predicted nucleotidyltransferase
MFGSRVRGRHKPFSDIDLCVVSVAAISDEAMGSVKEAFQASRIPFKVDVVDYHQISEEFRSLIAKDWIRIC